MDFKNILILSMVKGIGSAFIKKNLNRLSQENSCEEIIRETKPDEVENIKGYSNIAANIITDCKANNIDMVSIFDDKYPKMLREISDPPCILYMKGNSSLLENIIAIIGTRQSSNLGNKIAEKVGSYFSKEFAICNGLVEGIDEHSIYSNGRVLGNVVGIISGGLCYNETCSVKHAKIIEDVLHAGGLIISEYAPRQKEDKYSGSKASRIQAGLCKALILVQSKVDGGSKYTLKVFSKLTRPIGVIHFPSSDEYNSEIFGANRLIVEKKIEGIADMLDVKKTSSLSIGKIVPLTNKEEYEILVNEIRSTELNQQLWQAL